MKKANFFILFLFLSSCSLELPKPRQARLNFTLGKAQQLNLSQTLFYKESSTLQQFPAQSKNFNCYAVNVFGEGISPPHEAFNDRFFIPECSYPGIFSNMIFSLDTPTDITLEVLTGPSRKIQFLGIFRAKGCPEELSLLDYALADTSNIVELGSETVDVFSDTAVEINSTYGMNQENNNPNNPKLAFPFCE